MTSRRGQPWSADYGVDARRSTLTEVNRYSYLLELLTTEEIGEELLDLGDTGGTANKDDLINLSCFHRSVLEDLLDRLKGTIEGSGVQVFETRTGDLNVEVLTIEERVDLDSGLGSVGEGALGTLASSAETAESTGVTTQVLLGLAGELLLTEVKEVGIEVLTTKMGISRGGLNSEDAVVDVQKRDIKGTTTEIVDEDVALLVRLASAETVGDSGGSGLVDDTEDVEASNGTGILGSLTLVVIEVGWHSDNSLGDGFAEFGLSDLFHLWISLVLSHVGVAIMVHGPS